jgi:hypothetical protein
LIFFQAELVHITVYFDAFLVGVLSSSKESEKLVIEYNGQKISLPTDQDYAHALQKRLHSGDIPGRRGAARLMSRNAVGLPVRYDFDIYPDQTLTRVFELDIFDYTADGYNVNCIGWRNEQNPAGFLAPKGVIPGVHGNFVTDGTESFEIDVPYQFTNLCTSMGSDTVSVFRDFMATACRITSTPELPRADFLTSKGPELEKLLTRYLEAAYKPSEN